MASVTFEHVTKRFDGDVVAVDDLTSTIADGEFMVLLGPVGLRQDHRAAHDRRPRGHHRRQALDRRPRRERRRPAKTRRLDGVPELRPLPAHDRAPEHRVAAARPQATPSTGPTGRPASSPGPSATSGSTRRPGSSASSDLLDRKPAALSGRPAPAGGAGPGDRGPARRRSSWTSRCRTSTPSCGPRPGSSSSTCTGGCETTVVYVTHDQVEAMTMADRIAIMSAGRLQQVGTPQEVYDAAGQPVRGPVHRHPAHEHAAGHGHDRGGAPAVDVGRRPRPGAAGPGRPAGGRAARRRRRPPRAPRAGTPTGPSSIEGAGRRVAGPRVPGLRHHRRGAASSSARPAWPRVDAGGTARLAVDPGDVHLFDPDTTERLT